MEITTQQRAEFFKEALAKISEGDVIICPGLNNDEWCSSLLNRNLGVCGFCAPLEIVNYQYTRIKLIARGTIRKEQSL